MTLFYSSEKKSPQDVKFHKSSKDFNIISLGTKRVFLAFGLAMTVCSIFVVLFFLLKRAPLIVKKAWVDTTPVLTKSRLQKVFSVTRKLIKTVYLSLQSINIIYYIAYGVLAVAGTLVHPFFFAFHLTELLFR